MVEFNEREFKLELKQEIEKSLDKELENIADYILEAAKDNINSAGVFTRYAIAHTGWLAQSGDVERKPLKYTVFFTAPYAADIEYGTDPHYVSGDKLIFWVNKKLGVTGKGARSVAWAVATKISKEGTQPRPFLRNAVEKAVTKFGG